MYISITVAFCERLWECAGTLQTRTLPTTTPPRRQWKDTWSVYWTAIKGRRYRDVCSTTWERFWCHNLHLTRVAAVGRCTGDIHSLNFLVQKVIRNVITKSNGIFEERYTVSNTAELPCALIFISVFCTVVDMCWGHCQSGIWKAALTMWNRV